MEPPDPYTTTTLSQNISRVMTVFFYVVKDIQSVRAAFTYGDDPPEEGYSLIDRSFPICHLGYSCPSNRPLSAIWAPTHGAVFVRQTLNFLPLSVFKVAFQIYMDSVSHSVHKYPMTAVCAVLLV